MDEDIYGPSVPYLQDKTVCHNIQHVEPITIPNFPKGILDKYNKATLCCDLIHISGISFLNTTPRQIMFATGSMITTKKQITLKM